LVSRNYAPDVTGSEGHFTDKQGIATMQKSFGR